MAVSGNKKASQMAPATTNQNAFFEEYKQNLRKINSKKASSPNMKSSFTSSRFSTHGSQLPQHYSASMASSPQGSGKKLTVGSKAPVMMTPGTTLAFHSQSNNPIAVGSATAAGSAKKATATKHQSFIGSGIFNRSPPPGGF